MYDKSKISAKVLKVEQSIEKEDKIKYGTTDFGRSDTEGYAKDVQNFYSRIMKMDFR